MIASADEDTAYHEAAHAVIARVLGANLRGVNLFRDADGSVGQRARAALGFSCSSDRWRT